MATLALAFALAAAPATPALEEPLFTPLDNWHAEAALLTGVPLDVALALRLEGPLGLFVEGEAGVMPGPYFALINEAVVAVGGYDRATADLLYDALESSLVLRAGGGWRPFHGLGLEVFGGYTFANGSGALPAAETIETILGTDLPEVEGDGLVAPVSTSLHAFHVGLGWHFVLWQGLLLRVDLAYLQVVGSSSAIDVDAVDLSGYRERVADGIRNGLTELSSELDVYLNDTYTTYVKAPVVGVSIGWRL